MVGGGIAGSAAALTAAEQGASVLLIAKSGFQETNTWHAQGGMAAVLAANDSMELHLQDTVRVGAGLTDEAVAKAIIARSRDTVQWLQGMDASFDQDEQGQLKLSKEGGHSVQRVVHSHGDATGMELQRSLTNRVKAHPNIDYKEFTFVRDLLLNEGRCVGAVLETEEMTLAVEATSTILTSGGAGQVYRETTNPIGACGDGVALAFRAGAAIRDMEFVQFHPTTLYIAGASRFLISEVVRGAGAILTDGKGDRFMPGVDGAGELAPRDVVSRAILNQMVKTGDTHVYLDMSTVQGNPHQLFPSISRICSSFDIDINKDPVPVRPGAHYFIGGVTTDLQGRSSVPGLYVAGEAASTGFHGANRLASNSLLEGAVMGYDAGIAAANETATRISLPKKIPGQAAVANPPRIHLEDMLYSLKSLMWRQVGLLRNAAGLSEAKKRISFWHHYLMRSQPTQQRAWELANMLTISALVANAAEERTESRGTHFRVDYPAANEKTWHRHLSMRRAEDGSIELIKDAMKSAVNHGSNP